jgi:hypothetical protein
VQNALPADPTISDVLPGYDSMAAFIAPALQLSCNVGYGDNHIAGFKALWGIA